VSQRNSARPVFAHLLNSWGRLLTRRWSLRFTLMTLLFSLQLLLLIGMLVTARTSTERVLQDHAHNIMSFLLRTAASQARSHLAPAEATARLTGQLLSEGVIDVTDNQRLAAYFRAQLGGNASLSGLYLGRPDGSFIFVKRTPQGFYIKSIVVQASGTGQVSGTRQVSAPRQVWAEWRDNAGKMTSSLLLDDPFDPRQRPWYLQATAHTGPIWTQPYVFFTAQQPGITSAVRVMNGGRLIGVVGVDIEIATMSRFMSAVPSAEHGTAYLLSRNGEVLAGWGKLPPLAKLGPMPAVEKVADTATHTLLSRLPPLSWTNASERFQAFRALDQSQYGLTQPFQLGPDLHWLLMVRAPASDFSRSLDTQFRWSLLVVLLVGVFSWLLALPLLSRLARPVEQLRHRATTDALTQLANRQEFLERSSAALVIARLAGQSSVIVMLDLDGFKAVNDTHGHRAGDEVLSIVAQRLPNALPKLEMKVIGRLGGDEFALFLPGLTEAQATGTVERVRVAINQPIRASIGLVQVGVTIGLAEVCTQEALMDALERADKAMLSGKGEGKNRVLSALMMKPIS
jgi:diguanylate cyclase (GGDEF)-like protein